MSKICFTADHHVKLGQKNVPLDWQYNRFMMLADELNKVECDYHVFGGDLFDVAKPSIREVGMCYDFLSNIEKPIFQIPGNHEMETKKRDCYVYIEKMLQDIGVTTFREFTTHDGIDYIPYNILHKEWEEPRSDYAVTHVRGAIPPHVEPEIHLGRLSPYKKVLAGDLHSFTNSQDNILYPGSPLSTSFHRRVPSGSNGYILFDTETGEHSWHELFLPHLVRETVDNPDAITATDYHHTIYELEGTIDELGKVDASMELLDKKVNKHVNTEATLNLEDKTLKEELAVYLEEIKGIKGEPHRRLMGRFDDHTKT